MVSAFGGNKAETKTMLPVIEKFMAAHRLSDVTVVADAGMISEANQKAIEAAGLSLILGRYITNLAACPDGTPVTSEFVIGSYHELWNIIPVPPATDDRDANNNSRDGTAQANNQPNASLPQPASTGSAESTPPAANRQSLSLGFRETPST
jgi:hypothetical protein